MKDLFLFRKLLTPVLIQLIFWLMVVFFIYIGTKDLINGLYITALQVLIAGPLLARIVGEVLILTFQINASLAQINQKLDRPR